MFYTKYNRPKKAGMSFPETGRTEQHHKKDADINVIVARYKKTGVLPKIDRQLMYGDFTSPGTYQDCLNVVIQARDQFAGLSADLRDRFRNDPALFLKFVNNPENEEKMIEYGLKAKPVISHEKLETPEGNFWVTRKDGVEIGRKAVVEPAKAGE